MVASNAMISNFGGIYNNKMTVETITPYDSSPLRSLFALALVMMSSPEAEYLAPVREIRNRNSF